MTKVIDALQKFSQCPNIWELAHDLGIDTKGIDSAIPQQWADRQRETMGFNPKGIAWSYVHGNHYGEPINFPLMVLEKLAETIRKQEEEIIEDVVEMDLYP